MADTIIRVSKKESPFAQIDRDLINDKRMGFDTRGLLIWLLDKPDGWEVSITALVNQSPAGRSIVRKLINEAMELGYIKRKTYRVNGRFNYEYEIREKPDDQVTPPCSIYRRGDTDAVAPTRSHRRGRTDAVDRTHSNTVYSNTDLEILNYKDSNSNTHHHHPQTPLPNIPDDDDDVFDLSNSPHFLLSKEIVSRMSEWTGSETFLRSLDESQLIAAASWLYLWFVGKYPEEVSKYKKWPLVGVDNIVGKIIAQARLGNVAPLCSEHQQGLTEELKEFLS